MIAEAETPEAEDLNPSRPGKAPYLHQGNHQLTARTHPLRERIEAELLAGKNPAEISKANWLYPKLSRQSIWGYWSNHVRPKLSANTSVVKALAENGLLSPTANHEAIGKALTTVTESALASDPLVSRILKHQATLDKSIADAEDGRTVAALVSTDLKGLELQARLTGRLDGTQQAQHGAITVPIQVNIAQNAPSASISVEIGGKPDNT